MPKDIKNENIENSILARGLQHAAQRKGLTQHEIAEILGKDVSGIGNLFTGKPVHTC